MEAVRAVIFAFRPGAGPAILSCGFRPFFLLGALQAGFPILFWLSLLHGRVNLQHVLPDRLA